MKKVLGLSIILVFLTVFLYLLGPSPMRNPDSLFIYFYMHNVNLNIIFNILFIMIYSLAVLDDYYQMKNNKFDNICIVRIGYKKYYLKCIREIIVKSIVFKVSFELLFLASLYLIIGDFKWTYDPMMTPHTVIFNDNLFVNLVLYLISSTFGLSIFGIFIFSIIDFISNLYIFRIVSTLITIISVVILSIIVSYLSPIICSFYNNLPLINTILYSPSPINLIEPGSIWENYGILSITITGAIYIIVIIIVFKNFIHRRKTYG